ncbi:MAG: GatB/YqeY domain-containing protein [Bacteroidota bacterium]
MSIQETILADMKTAMKQKEKDKLRVLRSLKTALMEKEISERKEGEAQLNDEQVTQVLMKAAKQRKDSIQQFEEAGRDDLAQQEKVELEIIESYLPEMMGEDEIRELAQRRIKELGASSMSDMGKVMGALMPEVKGKADGSLVNKIVKEELNG